MNMPVFSLSEVDAGYRNNRFINGLNFAVNRGDFISLIGPNGAGKSTVLRLMAGLHKPFSGSVEFTGRPLHGLGARELARNFSVVSRITGELPDFRVKDFISLGRFPFVDMLERDSDDSEEYSATVQKSGVSHLLDRSIRELSAGEFQLVQVTRALVQNSDILLLDEPVSNLDYSHVVTVMDILRELHRGGTTIISAMHDVNYALEYCSRVVAIKKGKVIFDGAPEEVITESSMKDLYGSRFYCGVNPVTGRHLVLPVSGEFS
ncbi:MAG TPA: ABC transporter ATP-binding protein [Spirochaetota bacterium]|nr:ABC transporter ATP-binding protein [Spirochaetota bacterium]HPJ34071.1 ABC transporter ATP-binding protein [Spirochaetota bacterium]